MRKPEDSYRTCKRRRVAYRLFDSGPRLVRIVLTQSVGQLGRLRAEIFLLENSILIDNKRHHARVRVCRGIG